MGEVISKRAARDKIIEDVKTTRAASSARSSQPDAATWSAAETRLAPIVTLWGATTAKLAAANADLTPLHAAIGVADAAADDKLKGLADSIWNDLGRPANDPVYELLFPGGAGFYVDGSLNEQPDMMVLLAELLESNLHPKLAASASASASAIRTAAAALEAATEAARKPAARVKLYDRMLTAIARAGHVELARLKRYWKSEGISEADIHTVIPDRPRSYGTPDTTGGDTPVTPPGLPPTPAPS